VSSFACFWAFDLGDVGLGYPNNIFVPFFFLFFFLEF
jgi:hypothetical protein